MWEISVRVELVARHQIRGVAGEGGRVHEHRWEVCAVLRADALDRTGWVRDFHEVDALLGEVVAPYRGAFLNEVPPFQDVNPTRENLARVLAERLAAKVDDGRVRVHRVDVGEDGHRASYVTEPARSGGAA
jgi:6-pyruvoyltetrahydropterin/6-carboxytetrahydropterin synthase